RGNRQRRARDAVPRRSVQPAVRHQPLYARVREHRAGLGAEAAAAQRRSRPPAAQPQRCRGPRAFARAERGLAVSARSRELFGLIPVTLLVTGGFTAVLITRSSQINKVSITYGLFFLGCCVFAHIFIRARLPHADPYLFPLGALLAAFGLVMIYRIDTTLARQQAEWFVVGLALFCATIVFLRDYRVLERYRYTIAAASIGLLLLPRVPGIGGATNGAYLAIHIGSLQFQPAEFAKIGIVIFLASYLR